MCGVNRPQLCRQQRAVGVATVYLVGIDELDRVTSYLDLGAVVVIAPDRDTLRSWQKEQGDERGPSGSSEEGGVVVDLAGRQVLCWGERVDLSDLEFMVMAALMSHLGRAWSFSDIRRAGWGEGPELPVDIASVRSLVQRLRVKLRAIDAPVTIVAVRGFGFRVERAFQGRSSGTWSASGVELHAASGEE